MWQDSANIRAALECGPTGKRSKSRSYIWLLDGVKLEQETLGFVNRQNTLVYDRDECGRHYGGLKTCRVVMPRRRRRRPVKYTGFYFCGYPMCIGVLPSGTYYYKIQNSFRLTGSCEIFQHCDYYPSRTPAYNQDNGFV